MAKGGKAGEGLQQGGGVPGGAPGGAPGGNQDLAAMALRADRLMKQGRAGTTRNAGAIMQQLRDIGGPATATAPTPPPGYVPPAGVAPPPTIATDPNANAARQMLAWLMSRQYGQRGGRGDGGYSTSGRFGGGGMSSAMGGGGLY
jgi:hypothetical protein